MSKFYAKKYLNAIDDIKAKDTNAILSESTKNVLNGATIGAGAGLLVGFAKKKNLLLSAFVGSIIGGIVSTVFLNIKNKKDE
jgi:hypothetical protein